MALPDLTHVVASLSPPEGGGAPQKVTSSSPTSNWVVVNTDATAADNGGSTVTNPAALTSSRLKLLTVGNFGTYMLARSRYTTADPTTTEPVVQVFGFDSNGVPMRLLDADGNHEVTLADDATNDIQGSVYGYTTEKSWDCRGCQYVLVAIKTAAAGSATTDIEARIL